MIPWLLALALISERGEPLSALVGERMRLFPASGEINRHLSTDVQAILARVRSHYEPQAGAIDFTDGLSMEFDEWRFNLRGSNTEPLVRLNVESRGSAPLMREKTAEVLRLIDA
jgi:phosphomannomutase/phosphomannomutase/phosphoglucomutase